MSPLPGRVSHDVAATPAASLTNLQALAQQAVAAGLDRPGKSVDAIPAGDPESETDRVLIRFTMPMPEIKGDNEDERWKYRWDCPCRCRCTWMFRQARLQTCPAPYRTPP
ncbi:hypothetical protein DDE05_40320 [Streptomyces cavourensis]|nr:hypothetical protein DDE05_40320 [Streptomyces cavourensis]